MTLYVLKSNVKMIFSVYSIYVRYVFRPDLATVWLLVQERQGPEICELPNLAIHMPVALGGQYLKTGVHDART